MASAILYCGLRSYFNGGAAFPQLVFTLTLHGLKMGLAILVLGLAVFMGSHPFVGSRSAGSMLTARLGYGYRIVFSAVSVIGLALIVYGYADYRAHEWTPVWDPPDFMRHITIGLMLIAVILLVAQFVPSHIKAKAKFPAIAAVKTWALAHLLVNGDRGSIVMFGAFLVWSVFAFASARRRKGTTLPVAPAGWINDAIVVVLGVIVFLALGYIFHPYVIGVPVFRG
jgi:uncharacterized membrane protein